MIKLMIGVSAAVLCGGCGIRSIELVRTPDGYDFEYTNIGLKTDVEKVEIEKGTNGTIRCVIDGVATDVSAENKRMIEASGTAVGNVAQKVVEGLK
ncbi:MAG: hypothetical protein E7046_13005 [Lentisphaerae bacterium]|nr:hypothetical protein [Lentisphaerota bacterium]